MSIPSRRVLSTVEKSLLLQLIDERKVTLESKIPTRKEKEKVWVNIMQKFNASDAVERRSVAQLKKLYLNFKKNSSKISKASANRDMDYTETDKGRNRVMALENNVLNETATNQCDLDVSAIKVFNVKNAATVNQDMEDVEFLIATPDIHDIPATCTPASKPVVSQTLTAQSISIPLSTISTTPPPIATPSPYVHSQDAAPKSIPESRLENASHLHDLKQACEKYKLLQHKRDGDNNSQTSTGTATEYISEECQERLNSTEKANARIKEEHEMTMKQYKMEQKEHEMQILVCEEQKKMYEMAKRLLLQNQNMSLVLKPNL